MNSRYLVIYIVILFGLTAFMFIGLASDNQVQEFVVESEFLWDGGSRVISFSNNSLSPLLIVLKNPFNHADRSQSILCGSDFDSLIVVKENTMLEKILIDQLESILEHSLREDLKADVSSALSLLMDRSSAWPEWKGRSSVDRVKREMDAINLRIQSKQLP